MSEPINTHSVKHKSWPHNVAFTIRLVALLAHLQVAADLVLIQTDLIIVFTAVAEDSLQERESWAAMVDIIFQRITGRDYDNARPNNHNYARGSMCGDEYRHRRFVEADATTLGDSRNEIVQYRKTLGRLRGGSPQDLATTRASEHSRPPGQRRSRHKTQEIAESIMAKKKARSKTADNPTTGKKKGMDRKACWSGYRYAGTQKKGGKVMDKCVKTKKAK